MMMNLMVSKKLLQVRHLLNPFAQDGNIRWSAVAIWYLSSNAFQIASWNAKFWDQWFLYGDVNLIESIDRACPISRCKVPFTYLWESPLFEIGHWTVRIFVILLFWCSGFFLWRLLRNIPQLNEQQRTAVTVFFLLLPINGARIGLSTARASLALVLLVCGGWLVTTRKLLLVPFGLLLVGYSAFQPSLQVMALAILIPLVGSDIFSGSRISSFTWAISVFLVMLPLVHRYLLAELIVNLGFAGPSDGYNSIQPAFLARALLVCAMLSIPVTLRLSKWLWKHQSLEGFTTNCFEIGLLLLALGTFPYLAVGHFANLTDWVTMWLPDTSDWDSRHQVLQGFGFSILGLGLVQLTQKSRQMRVTFALLTLFFVLSSSTYANYYIDGLKQRDIMSQLESSKDLFRTSEFIMFVDYARDLNARGRGIRDYEYSAMTKAALGRAIPVYDGRETDQQINCVGQNKGTIVTIRKVSGRLRALINRVEVVRLEFSPLVVCT